LRAKDGIVFAVEKLIVSNLLEPGSNRRINAADKHIGIAAAGLMADTRNLVNRARAEAENYKCAMILTLVEFRRWPNSAVFVHRGSYSADIPVRVLADRIGLYMQAHTIYGSVRPFGSSVLIGGFDKNGPQLYMAEPSGMTYGYFGAAAGKAAQAAKTEIEKLKLSEMTTNDALVEAAKMYD